MPSQWKALSCRSVLWPSIAMATIPWVFASIQDPPDILQLLADSLIKYVLDY